MQRCKGGYRICLIALVTIDSDSQESQELGSVWSTSGLRGSLVKWRRPRASAPTTNCESRCTVRKGGLRGGFGGARGLQRWVGCDACSTAAISRHIGLNDSAKRTRVVVVTRRA
eukprot:1192636-Prorocentrum_minimum.AAC.5